MISVDEGWSGQEKGFLIRGKKTPDGKCSRQVCIVVTEDEETSSQWSPAVNLSNWFVGSEGSLIELYSMLGLCWRHSLCVLLYNPCSV